jgi:hypothetical protein
MLTVFHSALRYATERRDERVRRFETARAQFRRPHRFEGFQLHGRIRSCVDFRRLHVCVSEPQRDFRKSLVACSMVRAHVCLNRCGNTRFVASEGHRCLAVWTCLRRMYSMVRRDDADTAPAGPSRSARIRRPPGSKYADSMTSSFVGVFRTEKNVHDYAECGRLQHTQTPRRDGTFSDGLAAQLSVTICSAFCRAFLARRRGGKTPKS